MDFKSNANKLHYLLSERFDNVDIQEKSSRELGNYVKFSIKEELQCDVIITKKDLQNSFMSWKYNSNPLNENSDWVERSCEISEFTDVIEDILQKRRFSSDYLKNV
jgi:hypothetical protein